VANFTYFIITPGYDLTSFVRYPGGQSGCYIKFGDQQGQHGPNHAGIRGQYLTHNPDIGVAAIMESSVFAAPALGTRLKNFIINTCGIAPVGQTEWFSVKAPAAWKLFGMMQQYDFRNLQPGDQQAIEAILAHCLT
jgi:hypothetical protein